MLDPKTQPSKKQLYALEKFTPDFILALIPAWRGKDVVRPPWFGLIRGLYRLGKLTKEQASGLIGAYNEWSEAAYKGRDSEPFILRGRAILHDLAESARTDTRARGASGGNGENSIKEN